MSRWIDIGSAGTIFATIALFVLAAFLKGLKHDLLLETGVFLVSAKLILMAYKSHKAAKKVDERLDRIEQLLADRLPPPAPPAGS